METYDYQQGTRYVNELGSKIDLLSQGEAKEVSEFIDTLKEKSEQEQTLQSVEWCKSVITPVLQDFAEMTYSCLTVEQPKNSIIIATLINKDGFDITESCRLMRTLLNLSSHIGINSKDNETSLTLIFDCNGLIG